jgi:hypothetical protein
MTSSVASVKIFYSSEMVSKRFLRRGLICGKNFSKTALVVPTVGSLYALRRQDATNINYCMGSITTAKFVILRECGTV